MSVTLLRLRQQGLPAKFLLNGQALEYSRAYWWERLQTAYASFGSWRTLVPSNVLAAATAAAGDRDPEAYEITIAVQHISPSARGAWAETLLERVGEDPPDAGLRAAHVSDPHRAGFAIAFHGSNHEPLSLLALDELEAELSERREPLGALVGEPLRVISYPHGQVNGGPWRRRVHMVSNRASPWRRSPSIHVPIRCC